MSKPGWIVICIVITTVLVFTLNRWELANPGLTLPHSNGGIARAADVTVYIGDGEYGCAFVDMDGDVVAEAGTDTLLVFKNDVVAFVNTYDTQVTVEFSANSFSDRRKFDIGPRSREQIKIVGQNKSIAGMALSGCPSDHGTPQARVGDYP